MKCKPFITILEEVDEMSDLDSLLRALQTSSITTGEVKKDETFEIRQYETSTIWDTLVFVCLIILAVIVIYRMVS